MFSAIKDGCDRRNSSNSSRDNTTLTAPTSLSPTTTSPNNENETNFMIQNIDTEKCLQIAEQKDEYPSENVINAIWTIEAGDCDSDSNSQYWYWSQDGNQVVHKGSGLCLSSTMMGVLVLNSCEFPNWRTHFLCAGFYIEHPKTEDCISVIQSSSNQTEPFVPIDQLQAELEELEYGPVSKLQQLSEERGQKVSVVVEQCNLTNSAQRWRAFQPSNSTAAAVSSDKSICNVHSNHELHKCYNETLIDSQNWLRCTIHGYFVSGIYFYEGTTRVVSSILCCQSPYSYWENLLPFDDTITHSSIICTHQTRWTSITESKLECENDEYLRALKLKDIDSSSAYFSFISVFECCRPERQKRVYRHCYLHASAADLRCSRRGYFVTSLTEVVTSFDGKCNKDLKCCV